MRPPGPISLYSPTGTHGRSTGPVAQPQTGPPWTHASHVLTSELAPRAQARPPPDARLLPALPSPPPAFHPAVRSTQEAPERLHTRLLRPAPALHKYLDGWDPGPLALYRAKACRGSAHATGSTLRMETSPVG
ncbi:unnamed protein product [Pleuronectes platessa]|uniref:Uncharacterized protein n=1 Tax=Pleuronectes platessa TaxID=8262 RepID=A0A9N7UQ18_PLEPL|nr:unnamed protein product [Pleuronectes platessa]